MFSPFNGYNLRVSPLKVDYDVAGKLWAAPICSLLTTGFLAFGRSDTWRWKLSVAVQLSPLQLYKQIQKQY